MPTVKIYNLNTEAGTNTRFRLLKTESSEVNVSGAGGAVYEFLDSVDFCLSPLLVISCEGALSFAGVITTDTTSGTVQANDMSDTYSSPEQLVNTVNQMFDPDIFQMYELEYWDPALFPRAAISFLNNWNVVDHNVPNLITVKIKRFGQPETIIEGTTGQVLDECANLGILIGFMYNRIQIGTKPGTPRTEVTITCLADGMGFDEDTNDTNEDWLNPTLTVNPWDRGNLKVILGWVEVHQRLWQKHEAIIEGLTGDANATLTLKISNKMIGGLVMPTITDPNDYTAQCSAAGSPLQCQISNQSMYYQGLTAADLDTINLKFDNFNHSKVVVPVNTSGDSISPEDYQDIVILPTSVTSEFGYAIPIPEAPM